MASRGLAAIDPNYNYSSGCGHRTRSPNSSLLNSIFMSTVNTAARTLVSVASTSKTDQAEKWRPSDHLRFMFMLMTWLTLWFLRVLMDYFPCLCPFPSLYPLERGFPPLLTTSSSSMAATAAAAASASGGPSSDSSLQLALVPSAAANSLEMILYEGDDREPSVNSLGRALSHILALLNEIPANSRKYQFAMAMADRIMDENARNGHVELLRINRTALSSAFAHTSTLLYRALQRTRSEDTTSATWPIRIVRSLPMGSYVASYVKGVSAVLRFVGNGVGAVGALQLDGGRQMAALRSRRSLGGSEEEERELASEKLAQELLWISIKMKDYGAVDEALAQWSYSSDLASASLTANPRVQGFIIKIFAILFGELAREKIEEVSRQVKFGLLVLWLPLCCHGSNGVSYPILTGLEKAEVERDMDQVISSLPAHDQEVILTNWFQDFTASASDWPNLQISYDRWCRCTRKQLSIN